MDPHGSVLHAVSSVRVRAVMEDCLEKLSFLGTITPDVLQHRDELSRFVGDEISRILSDQRNLEARYDRLIAQRSALKGASNKSRYKQVQAEIQDVSRVLRESTSYLTRSLKENPNVRENLLKVQRDRTSLVSLITSTVDEIRDAHTFGALRQKVESEQLGQDRLAVAQTRERMLTAAVRELEEVLARERSEFQSTVSEKQAQIAALKEELQHVKAQTAVDARYARREASAHAASISRTQRFEVAQLRAAIKDAERRLEMENVVHEETLGFLRKKHLQLDSSKAEWESKLDSDVGRIVEQRDAACSERDALLVDLTRLQRRREEELRLEAEERAERERLQTEEKERKAGEARERAAGLVILRAMRSFRARRAAAGSGRGSGKKEKKSKKAKKAKKAKQP